MSGLRPACRGGPPASSTVGTVRRLLVLEKSGEHTDAQPVDHEDSDVFAALCGPAVSQLLRCDVTALLYQLQQSGAAAAKR